MRKIKRFEVGSACFNMVYIEPGEFMMGSPLSEDGRSKDEHLHRVVITKGFYIGETTVTQELFSAVLNENPSQFRDKNDESLPVECVDLHDCRVFLKKLNFIISGGSFRLPSEAEWEYACRAGTQTAFNTGDCLSTDEANFDGRFPLPGCPKGEYKMKTVPVKSFPPNAWGLYEMHGNVSEWCEDIYDYYPRDCMEDYVCMPRDIYHVCRGGEWHSLGGSCRSASRCCIHPNFKRDTVGLRLARDVETKDSAFD